MGIVLGVPEINKTTSSDGHIPQTLNQEFMNSRSFYPGVLGCLSLIKIVFLIYIYMYMYRSYPFVGT